MQSNTQIWRITFLYFAFGFTWIFVSDRILHLISPGAELALQTYKGWIYIFGTTLMLFLLLKASQKKLVISNNKIALKDRVIAQTEEEKKKLQSLSDELKEANEELQAFNYSVSHDLKSPLRVMQGYAEILNKKYRDKMPEEDAKLLENISASAKRMNILTGNLLKFSSSAKVEMRYEMVDMQKLFEDCISECKALYPDAKYEVNVFPVPATRADKGLMLQVVSNLVSNAFKYSSKTHTPNIEIGTVIDGKANVYYVKDNGAGFDPSFKRKLFEPFSRWHSNADYEGSGIGLAIAERIVNRHHGEIWAESKVGEGSTFYFSLPLNINEA
jgi:light-regulated signal transduction histidine kinase (bacteriophytochrome)